MVSPQSLMKRLTQRLTPLRPGTQSLSDSYYRVILAAVLFSIQAIKEMMGVTSFCARMPAGHLCSKREPLTLTTTALT